MNPASPARYLVGVWQVRVWLRRVIAAGVARSTLLSQPCLGADWLTPLKAQ